MCFSFWTFVSHFSLGRLEEMRKVCISFAAVPSAWVLKVGRGFGSSEHVYLEPFHSAEFTEVIPENSIMMFHFSPVCIGLYCFCWTSVVQMFVSFPWLQEVRGRWIFCGFLLWDEPSQGFAACPQSTPNVSVLLELHITFFKTGLHVLDSLPYSLLKGGRWSASLCFLSRSCLKGEAEDWAKWKWVFRNKADERMSPENWASLNKKCCWILFLSLLLQVCAWC